MTGRELVLSRCSHANPFSCWEWTSYMRNKHRPGVRIGTKFMLAHRASYEAFVGPIPDGLLVLHDCDNPMCVNPSHLRLGSQMDNMLDMMERGRQKKSKMGRMFGARFIKEGNGWASIANEDGRSIYLGFFETEKEASDAATKRREEYLARKRPSESASTRTRYDGRSGDEEEGLEGAVG